MGLCGAVAVLEGRRLDPGSLTRMGPGFFPLAIGVLLILVGVLIAAAPERPGDREQPVGFDARGCAAVFAGVLAFMLFGDQFGFLAGAFSAVLIAALGDRTAKWKESVILATVIAAAGGAVFTQILKVPFPLIHWG